MERSTNCDAVNALGETGRVDRVIEQVLGCGLIRLRVIWSYNGMPCVKIFCVCSDY